MNKFSDKNFIHLFLAYFRIFVSVIILTILVSLMYFDGLILGFTEKKGFKYRRIFIRLIMWCCNMRVKQIGESTIPNALYICNHRMMMDPLVLLNKCDAYIVSKAEVENYPVLGIGAKKGGVIFVKRDDKNSRDNVKKMIGKLLSEGKSVALFAEGTVNLKPTTAEFKKGSFEEAARLSISVIPVSLDYRNKSLYWNEDTSLVSHFLQIFSHNKIEAIIEFGQPIVDHDPIVLMHKVKSQIDINLLKMTF